MRNGEPQIYTALATIRNGYVQSQWQRVQMFLTFNTIALPVVMATEQGPKISALVSVAGVLVHLILLQGTARANKWIERIDERLRQLGRIG
jgi:hypothetical protein